MSNIRGKEGKTFLEQRETIVSRRCDLDRRRGPGVRRSEERKAAEEGQMTDEQFEFLMTVEQYKKENRKPFPTWTEILEVLKAMGYRRVAEPQSLIDMKRAEKEVSVN
ncbi:MAG: hypothetical protein FVQ79_06625 [Planctomycetes bacterium]|nr:hypothetical protein [Planctomycetota bacterium]